MVGVVLHVAELVQRPVAQVVEERVDDSDAHEQLGKARMCEALVEPLGREQEGRAGQAEREGAREAQPPRRRAEPALLQVGQREERHPLASSRHGDHGAE